MRATLAIVVVALALIVSAALYVRSIDPRPAGQAMQGLLSTAVEEAKQSVPDAVDFALLADSYAMLARRFAQAELAHGSDADLRLYAQGLIDRPAPAGDRRPEGAVLAALHSKLLDALERGLGHVGSPDDRFVQVMMPLEAAIAELGRLADASRPKTAFRTTDPATLMAASGAAALAGWVAASSHTH